MTFAERVPIATALSTVADMKGYPYKPNATRVGDSWPRWVGVEHVSSGTFETAWQITIILPSDEQRREEWIEAHLQAIVDAVADALWVISIEPGTSADSPVLLINCRE